MKIKAFIYRYLLYCLIGLPICNFSIFAQTVFTISPPELIYNAGTTTYDGIYYTCDAVSATLKKDSNNIYLFRSAWNATFKFWGTLSNPEQHPVFTLNKGLYIIPPGINVTTNYIDGATNYANMYLKNIYDIGNGELIGFMHLEHLKDWRKNNPELRDKNGNILDPEGPFYPAVYAIGICYHNNNMGNAWVFCGDIIGPNDNLPGHCNIGGAPYVVNGDYFYVYFNEKRTDTWKYPAVARALKRDVIDSVRQHRTSTAIWHKYNSGISGNWDQSHSGITGLGERIISGDNLDMHTDAAYCNSLKQYLLIVRDDSKGGLYLYRSIDALHWINSQCVAADTIVNGVVHKSVYPYFASLNNDANTDCSVVGNEFYIYYISQHFEPAIPSDQPVYRVKLRVY